MFQELVPLVRSCEKVVLTLTLQGDAMHVVVAPVVKNAADAALVTPLALSATPAELDAEFATVLPAYSQDHRSLAEQVEATAAIMKAAASRQSDKATTALRKANATVSTGKALAEPHRDDEDRESDDASEEDADEAGVAGEGGGSEASAAPEAAAAEPAGTNLADLI